jgi:hypothetical protein
VAILFRGDSCALTLRGRQKLGVLPSIFLDFLPRKEFVCSRRDTAQDELPGLIRSRCHVETKLLATVPIWDKGDNRPCGGQIVPVRDASIDASARCTQDNLERSPAATRANRQALVQEVLSVRARCLYRCQARSPPRVLPRQYDSFLPVYFRSLEFRPVSRPHALRR